MELEEVEKYLGLDIDSFDEETVSNFPKLEKEIAGVYISSSSKIKKLAKPEESFISKIKRSFSGDLGLIEFEIFESLFIEEIEQAIENGLKEDEVVEIHKAVLNPELIGEEVYKLQPYERHIFSQNKSEVYRVDEGTDFTGPVREKTNRIMEFEDPEKYLEKRFERRE